MNDSIAHSSSTLVDDLLALAERINQDLPAMGAMPQQADISISPEQFDSLIASW